MGTKEYVEWVLSLPDEEKAKRLVFMYVPPNNIPGEHLTGEKRYEKALSSRWPYVRNRFDLDWIKKFTPGDTLNYRYNVPIRVKIDYDKCTPEVAAECFKCLPACPSTCLQKWPIEDTRSIVAPKDHIATGKNPTKYVVTSFFLITCNQCGKCVEVCPKDAISVTTVPITKPYGELSPTLF
jgi:ferredoxin